MLKNPLHISIKCPVLFVLHLRLVALVGIAYKAKNKTSKSKTTTNKSKSNSKSSTMKSKK